MGVLHPGDILIRDPLPLTDVFGRVERECAAAIMVMAGWAVGRPGRADWLAHARQRDEPMIISQRLDGNSRKSLSIESMTF